MKWVLFSSLIILCLSSFASLQAEDLYADNRKVMEKVCKLAIEKNWAALEKIGETYRNSKEETRGGSNKLYLFYSALDIKYFLKQSKQDISSEDAWLAYSQSIDEWEKQHPNSITTPVLRIDFLTRYAWQARGSGFANTVTEDGGLSFENV